MLATHIDALAVVQKPLDSGTSSLGQALVNVQYLRVVDPPKVSRRSPS